MATLNIQSTKGVPVKVIYPAVIPSGYSCVVSLRIGKKNYLPAYTDANLPYLVQFQTGQRAVMFMLSDILETSFWRKSRNAYNVFGQLHLHVDTKVGVEESERVARWLREQSAAWGVSFNNA